MNEWLNESVCLQFSSDMFYFVSKKEKKKILKLNDDNDENLFKFFLKSDSYRWRENDFSVFLVCVDVFQKWYFFLKNTHYHRLSAYIDLYICSAYASALLLTFCDVMIISFDGFVCWFFQTFDFIHKMTWRRRWFWC